MTDWTNYWCHSVMVCLSMCHNRLLLLLKTRDDWKSFRLSAAICFMVLMPCWRLFACYFVNMQTCRCACDWRKSSCLKCEKSRTAGFHCFLREINSAHSQTAGRCDGSNTSKSQYLYMQYETVCAKQTHSDKQRRARCPFNTSTSHVVRFPAGWQNKG